MRNSSIHSAFSDLTFIKLKDSEWLEKQRVAGKVAAGALSYLSGLVDTKSTATLLEMSRLAEEYILDNKCSCTFKGYQGFPEAVCISVNNQLVHGIPTEYRLQEGDLVSFDLGATFDGAIADTAITCMYGEPKTPNHSKLVMATKEALQKGIAAAKVGNRIGDIGNAVYKCAKGHGFNVIVRYGGHGLENNKPHAPPFVPNRSNPDEGIRIQPGLTIAIEPLLTPGPTETWVSDDGWTVNLKDINAHEEHTIYIHADHAEIITERKQMDTPQLKYLATVRLQDGTASYISSSDFDFCFQFLQQHIQWNYNYREAFIEDVPNNKIIVSMREINAHRI